MRLNPRFRAHSMGSRDNARFILRGIQASPLAHREASRLLRALCEIAPEIQHWGIEYCNRDIELWEQRRMDDLHAFATQAAARLGLPVEWGDPRGCVLRLVVGPELACYADGMSIAPDPEVSRSRRIAPDRVTL